MDFPSPVDDGEMTQCGWLVLGAVRLVSVPFLLVGLAIWALVFALAYVTLRVVAATSAIYACRPIRWKGALERPVGVHDA